MDDILIFFYLSMCAVIVMFIGFYLVMGKKIESKGLEHLYFWGIVGLILLTWLFLLIVNLVSLNPLDWFVYSYAISMTLGFLGAYYFITRIRRINSRWKKNYGDEDGWDRPKEVGPGQIGMIQYNGPQKGNENWNILAPLELLETDWFNRFYNHFEKNENSKIVDAIEARGSSDIPKSIRKYFKLIFKFIKTKDLPLNKKEDMNEFYKKTITPADIINDLKSIQTSNEISEKKYIFASRIYFWENEAAQKTADTALTLLQIGCFIGFLYLFLDILSWNLTGVGISQLEQAFTLFGQLFLNNLPQFTLILYETAAFSLLFFIGIYAGVSAMTLMAFRELALNLKFPLKNPRTGDQFIEDLGSFSISISLINGAIYGFTIPFIFSPYSQSNFFIFLIILVSASIFILGIFFLNAYGPHKMLVNTKKLWLKKLQKLLADEKNYETKPGLYERYNETYKEILNLREWTIAPPVFLKLIASIIIPVVGYFVKLVLETYVFIP